MSDSAAQDQREFDYLALDFGLVIGFIAGAMLVGLLWWLS